MHAVVRDQIYIGTGSQYELSLFQNGLFHAPAAAAAAPLSRRRHREGVLGLGVLQETLDAVGPVVAAAGLLPGQVHGLVHLGDGRRRQ